MTPDGDTLSWSLGGEDAAAFLVSSSGQLSTNAVMDYEEKGTRYLTLTVDDGNGGTDSVSFEVIVVDWPEPPPPPDDVTVTPLSPTVLSVTWTAPDMTGKPPVEGYSLRYVRTGSTLWKEHYMQHGFSGDTEIIYLDPDTSYDVQVVAHNE